jgi:putative membrane protein
MAVLAHTAAVQHLGLAALCVGATAVYARRWSAHSPRSTAALVSWTIAVVGFLVASSPIVEDWSGRAFTGHMVQHLILIAAVAPALVVAVDPLVVSSGPRGSHSRRLLRLLDRHWAAPAAALTFVGVLIVTHLTGVYDAALGSQLLHEGEHLVYLAAAVMLWATLRAGATRHDSAAPFARIAATLGVIAGTAVLGLVLVTATRPLIPTYTAQQGFDGALSDQRTAGAVMWIGGMLTSLPLLVLAFWRWATHEQAAAERRERFTDGSSRAGRGAC